MTRRLWITQGTYADKWITMKDDDADDAQAHHFGWARQSDWTVDNDLYDRAMASFVPADVSFLKAWEARVAANTYIPQETSSTNVAPTAITLSPNTIQRNQPLGTVVGLLAATDADQTAGHTFTTADVNYKIGGVNGNELQVASRPGPAAGTYPCSITAVDDKGGSFTGPVNVIVS